MKKNNYYIKLTVVPAAKHQSNKSMKTSKPLHEMKAFCVSETTWGTPPDYLWF